MKAADESGGLLFRWPERGERRLLLSGLILLSAVVHLAGFYVFRIEYPTATAVPNRSAEVALLTLDTMADRTLLHRIEAGDPAAFSRSDTAVPKSLLALRYRPSYAGTRSLPRQPELSPLPAPAADGTQGRTVIESALRRPGPAERIQPAQSTRVVFSQTLALRAPEVAAIALEEQSEAGAFDVAGFLIGVDAQGSVRFVFLQNSTGSPLLDRAAERRVQSLRFSPGDEPVAWGTATFHWGAEAGAQPPVNDAAR